MATKQKSGMIVLATLVIAAVIAALAWFFFFSPTIDDRAAAIEQLESQVSTNENLEIQILQLAARAAQLPEVEAEIEEIAIDIPWEEEQSEVIRDIVGMVEDQDLAVQTLQLSPPTFINNGITMAAAAGHVGAISYVEDLEFQDLTGSGFVLAVVGDYSDVMALVDDLQQGDHRYYLIEDIALEPLDPAPASGTLPQIESGFVRAQITGVYFTQIVAIEDPDAPSPEPVVAPDRPSNVPSDRNPFTR